MDRVAGLEDEDVRRFMIALRALAERNHDVANHFADMKARYTSATHWKHHPFICPPQCLDSTQPEDFGYGSPEWRERWQARKYRMHKAEVAHKLSCSRNLSAAVIAQDLLYSTKVNFLGFPPNPWGILPEISHKDNRRCVYVRSSGMRCLHYVANGILCRWHIRSPEMRDAFGEQIKSQTLREHYQRYLEDPDYKTARNEVAVLRMLLGQALSELKGKPTDLLYIDAVHKLCKGIAQTVDVIDRIETKNHMRLSVEQLQGLIDGVVGIVVKILEPSEDQLVKLSEGIGSLRVFKRTEMDTPVLTYGMKEAAGKKTTVRDAITTSGEIVKDAFTKEEVRQQIEDANDGIRTRCAVREVERELGLRNA